MSVDISDIVVWTVNLDTVELMNLCVQSTVVGQACIEHNDGRGWQVKYMSSHEVYLSVVLIARGRVDSVPGSLLKNGGRREPGNIHEKNCRLPVRHHSCDHCKTLLL